MEPKLKDPAFVAKMAKFVKASMKGWEYAKAHEDEAVKIILATDTTGAKTEKDQKRMMGEIGKLLDPGNEELDPKDYDRTVGNPDERKVRPGHHQKARRRLDPRGL